MSVERTVRDNAAVLLAVNVISALVAFVLGAVLARGLGEAGFGRYSLVVAWIGALTPLTEWGLNVALTRDLAARPGEAADALWHAVLGKVLLAVPVILALVAGAPWLAGDGGTAVVAALRWGALLLLASLAYSAVTSVLRAFQVMRPILWLTATGQLSLLLGSAVLVWERAPLASLFAWAAALKTAQVLWAFWFYLRASRAAGVSAARPPLRVARAQGRLHAAWPFALASLVAAVQLRLGTLLLGALRGDVELGLFASAHRFMELGRLVPGALYGALLPAFSALAGSAERQRLVPTRRLASQGLLVFAGVAVLASWLLGRTVLSWVYGAPFAVAAPVLVVLALGLVPGCQNSLMVVDFYSRGDERFANLTAAAGVLLLTVLILLLTPRHGALGTAVAITAMEAAVYLPYRWRLRRLERTTDR